MTDSRTGAARPVPLTTVTMQLPHHGPPDTFTAVRTVVPGPSAGQVRLRQTAVGVNFVDVYERAGQFHAHGGMTFPAVLGVQGAGTVEATGPGVALVGPGDRVAYVGTPGAYTGARVIDAAKLIRLPDDIDDATAAASLVRGLTAHYLLHAIVPVRHGDTILVHAASSGVGLILAQWARASGVRVIGTAGGPERVRMAVERGGGACVDHKDPGWPETVRDLTGGAGVAVAYDSIGRDTFAGSLACLRERGMAVNFGTTSGQVEPLSLQELHARSLSVCRPTLPSFVRDRREYEAGAAAFFQALRDGHVRLPPLRTFPLDDVARVHELMESRRLTGLPVLRI